MKNRSPGVVDLGESETSGRKKDGTKEGEKDAEWGGLESVREKLKRARTSSPVWEEEEEEDDDG